MRLKRLAVIVVAIGAMLPTFGSAPADASLPGSNGLIASAVANTGDIILLDPSTGASQRITVPGVVDVRDPAWSPDGQRLAFSASPKKRQPRLGEIYVLTLGATGKGQSLIRLTNSAHVHNTHPSWSPSGDRIAFSTEGVGISVVDPASGAITPLAAAGPSSRSQDPEWSPNGNQILFEARTDPSLSSDSFWLMNADGSGAVILFTPPVQYEGHDGEDWADWDPSGSRIVYSSGARGNEYVIVVRADGTQEADISPPCPPDATMCIANSPAWSPDGSTIVMWWSDHGLVRVDPDGENLALVATEPLLQHMDWQSLPT